jgi:hypothetical protein
MANVKFMTYNWAKTGLASATHSSTVTYVATPAYLNDLLLGRMHRGLTHTNSANISWSYDLTANRTINSWAVLAGNMTSAATMRVQISVTANYASVVADTVMALSALTQSRSPVLASFFGAVVGRHIRFIVNDFTNPDHFLECGEIAVGQAVEVDWNATYPLRERHYGQNTVQRTEGGVTWSYNWGLRREVEFPFAVLNETTRGQLVELAREKRGEHEPFLLHANVDNTAEPPRWVRLATQFSVSRVAYGVYQVDNLSFPEEPMPIRL